MKKIYTDADFTAVYEQRRKYILEGIGERQIIITSCEPDGMMDFADCVIEVKAGSYVSTYRK